MKKPQWATATATVAAMVLAAIPADITTLLGNNLASVAENDTIEPSLLRKTQNGGTVRVNVVAKDRADLPTATAAGTKVQSFDRLPMVTLKVDKNGLTKLAGQPGLVSVTEDLPAPATLNESVPLIGGDKAFAAGKTGAGTAIAVLDTGVATRHPFLGNRVRTEACYSVNDDTYGATSLCPNGTTEQEGTGSADADAGPCATMGDTCSHGTHVAGIAAGNGAGISGAPTRGVAPGADIVAIQVFSKFDSEDYCGAGASPCILSFTSSQIKGLEKVSALKTAGTNVIAANLSLGAGRWTVACDTDPRQAIIDILLAAGVATVVAAGNNGYTDAVTAPGCVSSAITVGATTDDDQLSTFTNSGPLLDFFAPGTGIVSSVPGGGYGSKGGTSMAAPHVSGSLAILRQAFPSETIAALRTRLSFTGKTITYTGGSTPRIDIGQALIGTPAESLDPKPRPTTIVDQKDYAIPDPGTLQAPITVDGVPGNASNALKVYVGLTHLWRGELRIDLVAPDGQAYPLKPLSAEGGGTISATYTVDADTAPANGTWKLLVQDMGAGANGTLTSWALTFPHSYEKTGSYLIADPGTLTSEVTVDGLTGKAAGALRVYVGATHEWRGDLKIDLLAPDGRTYLVRPANASENGGTISATYQVDAGASPANGTWKLLAQDTSAGSRGFLTAWSLTFPSFENQAALAIPNPGPVDSPITVSGYTGNAPKELKVHVEITHQKRGDLKIQLLDPNGRPYLVKATSTTDTGANIKKTYTIDASTSPASGTWKLRVEDISGGASGTLTNWTLAF
ncbi:MAG TPA: proprotein convertase P-domain-containing protein [Candidatus Limnocylindrales bacterium]|nr:proprotein convertase P-domain-containing protein [Candidatus Limnocylindrales bacterium]